MADVLGHPPLLGIDDFGIYSIPLSASSTIAVALQGSNISLTWAGAPTAVLQKTTSLNKPTWQDIPGTLGANSLIEPISGTTSFYRLIQR